MGCSSMTLTTKFDKETIQNNKNHIFGPFFVLQKQQYYFVPQVLFQYYCVLQSPALQLLHSTKYNSNSTIPVPLSATQSYFIVTQY